MASILSNQAFTSDAVPVVAELLASPSSAPVFLPSLPSPVQVPPPPAPFPIKTYTFRLSQFKAPKTPDNHDSDYVTVRC